MRPIALYQPRKLAFGKNCSRECVRDLIAAGAKRVFFVTSPSSASTALQMAAEIEAHGGAAVTDSQVNREPTIAMFERIVVGANEWQPDAVVGIGGGSPLDVAKLISTLARSQQNLCDVFGIDRLTERRIRLTCIPTTAGTGSEVSPNAILLDEAEQLKKGVISPHLVPDAAYIDPALTASLPPAVTAATALDALTHCVEAYTNRFAHSFIDNFALEGTRLISANLARAVRDGANLPAREALSLASLYGGLCLGPVNTAAVHALAYPLGSEFHIAHGLANAVLLPHVMEFNVAACPDRYARVAIALGAKPGSSQEETARRGVDVLKRLYAECGVPLDLKSLGIPESALNRMAAAAMKVTRLLQNNPRDFTQQDAEAIYREAYQ